MALIGVISREANVAGVDLEQWRRMVVTDPRLKRPPARDIVNPFTGKPAVLVPPDTEAAIVLDTVPVGSISVSDSDERELAVWAADGHRDDVQAVAATIAGQLGGQYIPIP